jgi:hypothetical protein
MEWPSARCLREDANSPLIMSAQQADPCPCEQSGASSSFGSVLDREVVIRFVSRRKDLLREGDRWRLASSSFARDDINGAREKDGRRSVSSFRGGGKTTYDTLVVRVCAANKELGWAEDPVVAGAQVSDLRKIVDPAGRREICVYADTTEETDPLGFCESHASIRKSEPAPERHERQNIAILRSQLSDAFTEIKHLISGRGVE